MSYFFLFLKKPADVGNADAELVLTIIGTFAKNLAGTNLAGGIIGFHHKVGQRSPVQTEVPLAYLAACVHHVHAFAFLL